MNSVQIRDVIVSSNDAFKVADYTVVIELSGAGFPPLRLTLSQAQAIRDALGFLLVGRL